MIIRVFEMTGGNRGMAGDDGLGVLMVDVAGLELTAEDRELLGNPQVGGVILGLYGRNYDSLEQLTDLVAAIRACNPGLLLAVDQEGGRVQRFRKDFTRLPPMLRFGELYRDEPARALELARQCGWLMAAEVLACGLDISFAPVLDLYTPASRIIADRAFAAEPLAVAQLAGAFIAGMHTAGMPATGKHFPGHGSVPEDSHVELPVDLRDLAALEQSDLLPFSECISSLDGIMPGHVLYPQVDSQVAALSPRWLKEVLRGRLGFQGVIFSDDLTMAGAAGAGDTVSRAAHALAAGCDMILVCNDRREALAVTDWLARQDYPQSQRLSAMRGRPAFDWQSLHAESAWQTCRDQITALLECAEE